MLKPCVYNFSDELRNTYPDRQYYIVSDNAGSHGLARDLDEFYRKRENKFYLWAPHPAKSPDLNMVEHLWDYLREKVNNRQDIRLAGHSQLSIQLAIQVIHEEYEKIPQSVNDGWCSKYHYCLQKTLDCNGDNRFNG